MDDRMRHRVLIAAAAVLALLSIGAGALIALSSDDDRHAAAPTDTPSVTPSPTGSPSKSPEPTEKPEPSASESPILEDGHHFVYVKRAVFLPDGSTRVRFDLAYFYTDERAVQEATDRGDEVVNGYYIVNDNPRLRMLPLAEEVEVEYVPRSQCCELQAWDIDPWVEAIGLSTNPTEYPGKDVPWWFTVEGGEITRIEQQYLP